MALTDRTRLVLHHPFFPENIGAVARAMHNTGLADLRVVRGASASHERAVALAIHAGDLLEASAQAPDLPAALDGATLVFGTTARTPDGMRTWTPREAASVAAAHEGPVAIVFGNEKNGLSTDDLRLCHAIVRIPCVVPVSSLNLAQAAMVLAYEWMLASAEASAEPTTPWTTLAAEADVAALAGQVEAALGAMGFFKPPAGDRRRAAIQQALARLRLDPGEAAAMRQAARRWRQAYSAPVEGGTAGS